jgi:hypothetical protein
MRLLGMLGIVAAVWLLLESMGHPAAQSPASPADPTGPVTDYPEQTDNSIFSSDGRVGFPPTDWGRAQLAKYEQSITSFAVTNASLAAAGIEPMLASPRPGPDYSGS